MEQTTRGRGLFYEHAPKHLQVKGFPTKRQLHWMQKLALHGCLPSSYLFAFEGAKTEAELRAAQYQLRQLWRKRPKVPYAEGFIYRPRQQRATDNANYNEYVYDLTERGWEYLEAEGLLEDFIRPTGPWVHQLFVSCLTATADLLCDRDGYAYIPPHDYLAGRNIEVAVPFRWKDGKVHTRTLNPDAVFGIGYGKKRFMAFALEADRGTETEEMKKRSTTDVKTTERMILQYREFIGRKMYKKAYGREAAMVLLFITKSEGKARKFIKLVGEKCSFMAAGFVEEMGTPFKPPAVLEHIWNGELLRAGMPGFVIKKPPSLTT